MTTAQHAGKVVSLKHRPPLPPGNPSYWTQHPEKTPSPAEADRHSAVQGVWSKRGNLGPHSL